MMYDLIIFDVDGTFYNLDDVIQNNYNMQVTFYAEQKNISAKSVRHLFEKNGILPYKSVRACSATEFFLKNGIEAETWRAYRETHTSVQNIRRETAVSNELIRKFSEQAKLVLLSSNSQKNIQNILEWLKIDRALFGDIFCSNSGTGEDLFSKFITVPKILEKYNVKPASTLCIGDRYESDIRPLVELGGGGVLIKVPADLEEVFQDLSSGLMGVARKRSYKYFESRYRKEAHGE